MTTGSVTIQDVERLVAALTAHGGWMTAAQISATLFGAVNEGGKRRVRAIANAAGDGIVSYPGSPGYKLWRACTAEEIHACVAAYGSQTDEMRRRRDLYRRRLHRENPARIPSGDPELRPSREQLTLL